MSSNTSTVAARQPLTLETTRRMLEHIDLGFDYNDISGKFEVFGLTDRIGLPEIQIRARITDFLNKTGYSPEGLEDLLTLIACEDPSNAVEYMLERTEWDGKDRISVLTDDVMGIKLARVKLCVRRWLLQTLIMGLNSDEEPYRAEGILTFQGRKDVVPLLKKLAVYDSNLTSNARLINVSDSRHLSTLTSTWITEITDFTDTGDIFESLRRIERGIETRPAGRGIGMATEADYGVIVSDAKAIKSFLLAGQDTIRTPFGTEIVKARRTSFCVSRFTCALEVYEPTSPDIFALLRDIFWVVDADDVNLEKVEELDAEWFKQLWKQVETEYVDLNFHGFGIRERELLTADD